MSKSLHSAFIRWFSKGLLGLLSVLMFMILSMPQLSIAHASNTIPQNVTSTSNIRTTFVLGGYGPAIAMVNEHEGWGNGLQGTVHTSDGGQTWQALAPLADHFGGPDYVFDGQTLWDYTMDTDYTQTLAFVRTNDGGQSWTSFANPDPTLHPTSFSVIDRQRAWVSMYDYNTNNQALYLVGGNNQATKKATLPNQNQVSSIYFLSDRTGWVISNQELYRTTDGAKTWVKQNLPRPAGIDSTINISNIVPLGFSQQTIGFLQVRFTNPVNYASSNYVYRTINGGRTWNIYGGAQPVATDHIAQIDQWNLPNPALVGFRPNGDPQATLDELQHGQWNTTSLSTPTQIPNSCSNCFYSRVTSQLLFLSSDASDYPNHALDVYKSTDGGATWQYISSTPGAAVVS